MAITATDILYKFSVAAAAGNTTAGTAATSLGDQISTTQITDATLSWQNVVVWLSAEVAGGAVAAISVDTTGITALGSGTAQMKTIADENTAPATQTFSAPTTKATGLTVGSIAAGSVQGLWVRRTAANTAAVNNDGVTIRFEGDTAA